MIAVTVGALLVCAAVLLLSRRRRQRLAADAHEVRQAITSARLMIDMLPLVAGVEDEPCLAAGDELVRSCRSLTDFELRLHSPLWSEVSLPLPARRGDSTGDVNARAELERLAMIWGEAARICGRGFEFDWSGDAVYVAGPRRRLTEAVANLLSNAIRHGDGRISLSARVRGQALRIEVADEGPGLPRPVAALAACRRRPLRRLGPHGHGLAVATRAAQRLGGTLASAPSAAGASLVIELPVVAAELPLPSRASELLGALQRLEPLGDDG
ncbi:MAG: sensor histidine kinase [Actinobacteria bacterium]|nr:sensor histidine kinase [Actinomycetota bacterium]